MDDSAIDWLTERALETASRGESIPPAALQLLLRGYVAGGRDEVRDALGPALARAIDACLSRHPQSANGRNVAATSAGDIADTADWLTVLVEASALSDDESVTSAAESLVASLRSGWPSQGSVWSVMCSIDACLSAAGRLPQADAVVPAAIEELERVVGVVYEPGEGLLATIDRRSGKPGQPRDHIAAASALLTAYAVTGRLPYSMLAEELLQFSRRTWWDSAKGGFWLPAGAGRGDEDRVQILANCHACRVLCRLAALHEDPEYRAVAVLAHESHYDDDARRALEAVAPGYRDRGLDAAAFAVALGEWRAARRTHEGD